MIVLITDPARPKFHSSQFFEARDAELADAARGCVAYSGSWVIRGDAVVHDVEQSLYPNWVGAQLTRGFKLDGELLSLSTENFMINGSAFTAVLVWEKEH